MRLRSRFPLLVFALIAADHSVDKRFVLTMLGLELALGDVDAWLLRVVVKVDFTRFAWCRADADAPLPLQTFRCLDHVLLTHFLPSGLENLNSSTLREISFGCWAGIKRRDDADKRGESGEGKTSFSSHVSIRLVAFSWVKSSSILPRRRYRCPSNARLAAEMDLGIAAATMPCWFPTSSTSTAIGSLIARARCC